MSESVTDMSAGMTDKDLIDAFDIIRWHRFAMPKPTTERALLDQILFDCFFARHGRPGVSAAWRVAAAFLWPRFAIVPARSQQLTSGIASGLDPNFSACAKSALKRCLKRQTGRSAKSDPFEAFNSVTSRASTTTTGVKGT